jgi:hypothetical protein
VGKPPVLADEERVKPQSGFIINLVNKEWQVHIISSRCVFLHFKKTQE